MGLHISLLHTDSDRWALGIRSLSAVLRHAGHHTRLITMGSDEMECNSSAFKAIKELVKDSDIIGISCFSRGSGKARQVAEFLRPLNKLMVWGGMHATLNPEDCLASVDIVCRGEGEGFMLELVNAIEEGKDWKDIPNAVYKRNDIIRLNNVRPAIENLDDLPLIDYSNPDEFHYNGKTFMHIPLITDSTTPIMFSGSRGCHFSCNYCSNPKMKQLYEGRGRYVRKMSIQKFICRSKELKELFPQAKFFYFVDEDFLARSIDEFKEFADQFPKLVGRPFECMGSPPQITEEKMELLVKAGLWRIDVGMESGSERTKKEVFNRPMNNQTVLRSARIINQFRQVIPYYFFIIGNPYETNDDLINTIQFIKELPPPFFLRTYNLIFFPGSILYEMAVRDGIIKGIKDSGYEMDFLAGFNYKGHLWKEKNLYLNGLLYLMAGTIGKLMLGLIPRFLLSILMHPSFISFNEKNHFFIQYFLKFKGFQLRWRRDLGNLANWVLKDPTAIYNLRFHRKSRSEKVKPLLKNQAILP